jgi:hypothetical protein
VDIPIHIDVPLSDHISDTTGMAIQKYKLKSIIMGSGQHFVTLVFHYNSMTGVLVCSNLIDDVDAFAEASSTPVPLRDGQLVLPDQYLPDQLFSPTAILFCKVDMRA